MGKGLPYSRKRGVRLTSPTIKDVVRFNKTITFTDAAGAAGWGTCVLSGLPQGNLVLIGAVCYLTVTKNDANMITTFQMTAALGSAPTADNSLAGGEIDLIAGASLAVAVAGVSANNRLASSSTQNSNMFDNTDGSLEVNLNVTATDASSTANASVTFTGTLVIAYTLLGDD